MIAHITPQAFSEIQRIRQRAGQIEAVREQIETFWDTPEAQTDETIEEMSAYERKLNEEYQELGEAAIEILKKLRTLDVDD